MRKTIPIHATRLSNSTMSLVNTCERKFQLEKLLWTEKPRDETHHTIYGQAYGVGIAEYFINKDVNQAVLKTWLAYHPELEEDKKTVMKCINALLCTIPVIDNLLLEYEVAYFNGKPAAELSFCLSANEDYYYVGYLDLVLRNIFTGKYVVLDAKTTGLELHNLDPLYKNSGQLVGYSIALDAIAGEEQTEYEVIYLVNQTGREFAPVIQPLKYTKTLTDRLNWFITLGLDIDRITRMRELNVFPMRGDSCLKFNKPCYHFATCGLKSSDRPKVDEEDTTEYDFYFELQELIDNHVARVYS